MNVYVVINTYGGEEEPQVFNHYLFASDYLDGLEDNGAPFGQYIICGPLEVRTSHVGIGKTHIAYLGETNAEINKRVGFNMMEE